MTYEQHSDQSLLQLIVAQDAGSLEEFYDRYAQTTFNLITRIVRDQAVADELLQETFWQVWQKAADYDGRGVVAAWLYRIARNKSLDHLRRRQARPQPLETDSEEAEAVIWSQLASDTPQVEAQAGQRWDRESLRRALAEIPPEQRQCLELAYFEGLSQRRIAEQIDIPLGTVKTRMRIGLEKLQRILRASGYQAEDFY